MLHAAPVRHLLAAATSLSLFLTACAGTHVDTASTTAAAQEPASIEQAGSAFPVTIDHKYGTTTIPHEPRRVMSLGYQEHDTIFALGVEPIAVRYWYGDEDDVIFAWAEEAAGDADPEVLNMPELDFEKITPLEPDLILGLYSGMTGQDYDKLTAIAPTIAQTDDYVDYGTPWQQATLTIGAALGRSELAEQLMADVEGRFQAAARPIQAGTARPSRSPPTGLTSWRCSPPKTCAPRFFTTLGFEVPERFDELAGELFYATLSFEQAELLDIDVLVWDQLNFTDGGRATVEATRSSASST